ncbi:hypothetical protein [Hyphomicrobium sp. DY-1]|uniref:hypothetical protein n=1 Tax=Hyphomicrobium sp. DY-1 TaxID=3075650 RepID=UPI0039C23CCB
MADEAMPSYATLIIKPPFTLGPWRLRHPALLKPVAAMNRPLEISLGAHLDYIFALVQTAAKEDERFHGGVLPQHRRIVVTRIVVIDNCLSDNFEK